MSSVRRLAWTLPLPLLVACATPPEAQLATTCNAIAAGYRSAAIMRARGQLSPGAIADLTSSEPLARSLCDPTSPPDSLVSALALATQTLARVTAAQAGVK